MTSTPSKAKQGKAVTVIADDINAVDSLIADQFISFVKDGLSTEVEIWERMVAKHLVGGISVRGMKATLDAVAVVGALPSIASSTAQYFADTVTVRNLDGGKDMPLKAVLNVTVQGVRKLGKAGFAEAVGKASTFSALAKKIEATPAKVKAEGATATHSIKDLDGVVSFALGAIKAIREGDDEGNALMLGKIEDAEALVVSLQFFIRSSKAVQALKASENASKAQEVALAESVKRHPAKGSKVKA